MAMVEEYCTLVSLKDLVEQEKHNLDLFNMQVAKYRVKHGMSNQLIYIYGAMGRLSHYLMGLEKGIARLGDMWEDVTHPFQDMVDKEKE